MSLQPLGIVEAQALAAQLLAEVRKGRTLAGLCPFTHVEQHIHSDYCIGYTYTII